MMHRFHNLMSCKIVTVLAGWDSWRLLHGRRSLLVLCQHVGYLGIHLNKFGEVWVINMALIPHRILLRLRKIAVTSHALHHHHLLLRLLKRSTHYDSKLFWVVVGNLPV